MIVHCCGKGWTSAISAPELLLYVAFKHVKRLEVVRWGSYLLSAEGGPPTVNGHTGVCVNKAYHVTNKQTNKQVRLHDTAFF